MTTVHFVKRAAKAYPQAGIEKGDAYYWWQNFRSPRQMSKTRPKPSQTAGNDYERTILSLMEELESASPEAWGEDDRDALVSELEGARDGEQEKFDNMPEGFQMGDVGQTIELHVESLDSAISDLQAIDFEVPRDEDEESAWDEALAIVQSIDV